MRFNAFALNGNTKVGILELKKLLEEAGEL